MAHGDYPKQGLVYGTGSYVVKIGEALLKNPPTANAGGPYSVNEGGGVELDGAGRTDPEQLSATLTYEWDLDGDTIFGETGASAVRGDEVGITPAFSAAGLDGPNTVSAQSRRVQASSGR